MMTRLSKTFSRIVSSVALVGLGFATLAFGHGAALEKKSGAGGVAQEAGPHGGAVIDIGDGHFELVREADFSLSLYRLDDDLVVIPAEDVDAAEIHVAGATQEVVTSAMIRAGGDASAPLHFSIASPQRRSLKAYMAVISVSMGGASQNLRFLVKNG
jgi:hypothetical protein